MTPAAAAPQPSDRIRRRNRHAVAARGRGSAEPGKLVAQQALRIQYLDRAVAFGAFDDAIQKVGIDGARSGIVLLDPVGGKRQKVLDPVDDKSDRMRRARSRSPGRSSSTGASGRPSRRLRLTTGSTTP